jgi:WD40 repeat protein
MVREFSPELIDISKQGTLLVFPWGPTHVEGQKLVWDPRLLLWDYPRPKAALEFPLDAWMNWGKRAPVKLQGDWQFRFQGDGSRIVGDQTPWLVLIDVKKQAEIGRVVPSESYLREDSPGRPSSQVGISICHLSINPQNGFVAVVYNVGMDTHLYVYDSDLKGQIASRALPRMVKDLCWSPDGKKLAVLFHGRFDENRKQVSVYYWTSSQEPDVWVMDPHSGELLVKFRTGTCQDQIAFSKDGSLIYVTNDFYYDSPPAHKGAIRVFSADSGALVQTISAGPKGVHGSFSLSPDGSLIAADASTYVPRGLHMEIAAGEKIARVVLLDAKTGDLLFEHHERTEKDISDPLGLAFSPDGRFLFVGFPRSDKYPYQRIEVYSIDDINGPKH